MSLTSCVLPSLRRQTSCCKSFNIAVIQAMRYSSYLAFLCSDTTSCFVKGSSPLCLKATSFSPTGLEATSGILALFCSLVLEACSTKGFFLPFPLPSPQWSRQNLRVPFFLQHSGPKILGQVVMGRWTGLGSPQLRSCLTTKWCTGQASYNTNKLTSKNICIK